MHPYLSALQIPANPIELVLGMPSHPLPDFLQGRFFESDLPTFPFKLMESYFKKKPDQNVVPFSLGPPRTGLPPNGSDLVLVRRWAFPVYRHMILSTASLRPSRWWDVDYAVNTESDVRSAIRRPFATKWEHIANKKAPSFLEAINFTPSTIQRCPEKVLQSFDATDRDERNWESDIICVRPFHPLLPARLSPDAFDTVTTHLMQTASEYGPATLALSLQEMTEELQALVQEKRVSFFYSRALVYADADECICGPLCSGWSFGVSGAVGERQGTGQIAEDGCET